MQTIVQMSLEEYETLVAKQQEPSNLLKQTNSNLSKKIERLTAKVQALETELSTYKLGGAKPRPQTRTELARLVDVYNSVSEKGKIKDAVKRTATLFTRDDESKFTEKSLKQYLKQQTQKGTVHRDQNNNYALL